MDWLGDAFLITTWRPRSGTALQWNRSTPPNWTFGQGCWWKGAVSTTLQRFRGTNELALICGPLTDSATATGCCKRIGLRKRLQSQTFEALSADVLSAPIRSGHFDVRLDAEPFP